MDYYAGVPLAPMLVSSGPPPFRLRGFTHEIKFDGWRSLALVVGGHVRLTSRRGINLLTRFRALRDLSEHVQGDALLDGEIIAGAGRMEDFDRLLAASSTITYVVFDILALNGRGLISEPIEERRRILEETVEEGGVMARSRAFADGAALFREAISRGYEGIVSKRNASLYYPGERSRDWVLCGISKN